MAKQRDSSFFEIDPTERLSEDKGERVSEGVVIFVVAGPDEDRGRSVNLVKGKATVGTDPACTLVLHDSSVSRQHLELSVEPEGILARDLDSTNGVLSLGQRIKTAVLTSRATLQLGRCRIDIIPLDPPEDRALSKRESYSGLIGRSLVMRRLYTVLERLEGCDAPILIQGETGTGKDLLARALHEHSGRSALPFVVIDCGNLQRELVRSELFGHAKGSFTGADSEKAGAFELAAGGTVFIDEIGELPLDLQPALLRVLESGRVQRVGESRERPADVRVIAASNRDLREESAAGRFRQDLYYRLAVIRLVLSPLRERLDDLPLLSSHLATQLSGGKVTDIPMEVIGQLATHLWPGNVRELRNVVQRFLSLGAVDLDHGSATGSARAADFKGAREAAINAFEGAYLHELLASSGGSIAAAARRAGIDRKYLRDLLKKHNLYAKPDD